MAENITELYRWNILGFALLIVARLVASRIERADSTFRYMLWIAICFILVYISQLGFYLSKNFLSTNLLFTPISEMEQVVLLLIQFPFLIGSCVVLYCVLRRSGWNTPLIVVRQLPNRPKPWIMWLIGSIYLGQWIVRSLLEQPINHRWNQLIELPIPRRLWLVLFLLVAAFIEEMIYRYWLVDLLKKGIRKFITRPEIVSTAIAVTLMSLIFTAVHRVPVDGWSYLFLISLRLFLVRFFSGSIVFPTIVHYLTNLLLLLDNPAKLTDYFY